MGRLIVLHIILLLPLLAKAELYVSEKNGLWSNSSTWVGQQVPPVNINNQDTVIINHQVNASNLKVNNLGTMYVNRHLSAEKLTVNGPNSRVYVSAGSVLDAAEVSGNYSNIIYEESLPVVWLQFNCQIEESGHSLTWATAQEVDNDFIALEHSTDGHTFTELTRKPGTNTNQPAYYTFFNFFPQQGLNYYRLKQVDFDGTVSYSKVIAALQRKFEFVVSATSIQFNAAISGTVAIIKMNGAPALVKDLRNQDSFTFPPLPAGLYVLKIESKEYQGIHKLYLQR